MKVDARRIKSEFMLNRTLEKMYVKSKDGNEPFYNLIELMKNRETIITAIHNIKSNKGSKTKGVDSKDIYNYLQLPEETLLNIIRSCIDNYHPNPVRRVYIPKANGKKRPLGIPTMLDRIIQELARIVLEPIAEGKFYEYSFGFRPNRSIEHAQREVLDRVQRSKMYIAIEGDIRGYFDNIDHNKLLKIMWSLGIRDKRFLMLIKKMLKAGVMENNMQIDNHLGTPQGGIISPLLANIYLNNFDWMIARKFQEHPARYQVSNPYKDGLRRVHQKHKKCQIIRYADDWVILCEDMTQAESLLRISRNYLKHILKLELSEEKTIITDLRKNRVKFLGFEFFVEQNRSKKTKSLSCHSIPDIERLKNKVRQVAKEIRKIHNLRQPRENVAILEKVNSMIVGIADFYKTSSAAHIMKRQDQKLYQAAYKKWCKLQSGGQKRRWENYVIPAKETDNRPNRHQRRNDRIFYLEADEVKIGLTKFSFTEARIPQRWKTGISCYTEEGRKFLETKKQKKFLLERDVIYSQEILWSRIYELKHQRLHQRYNFEYIMNREYAYNRDKGKCRCCDTFLFPWNVHCHHTKPWLPLHEVNKVTNLATVCQSCHLMIHKQKYVEGSPKTIKKIEKLQHQLTKETADYTVVMNVNS